MRIIDRLFAETEKFIVGYTLILARSRDEAVACSRSYLNPTPHGSACKIEVRQLFGADDFASNNI